jgi:RNA polymerase-binding transcription factor DksA
VTELEARIEDERARTAEQIESLRRSFDDIVESTELANDDEHDPDGSTIAFERAKVAALLRSAEAHLAELDAVDARRAAGTYGRCERCGGAIGSDRLHALPTTRACVRCA